MDEEELLKNEKLEKILSPHPLSFMKYQSLCIYLIIWAIVYGWLFYFSEWSNTFAGNFWLAFFFWVFGLLLAGIVAYLGTVKWTAFMFYIYIIAAASLFVYWLNLQGDVGVFLSFFTLFASIVGFIAVEWYRRSHKYIISNKRIVFKGGIVTKEERTLRYDKISDINAKQGIMGQIFGFGTIIPISQSGFGLGADKAMAAGGVALGGKKAKLFGLVGGGKEVQTPMARTYYELHGIYPFKEVKKTIEEMVQDSVVTPYQQEQVAFQKEQVDIQKQMRDLLKMQSDPKDKKKKNEKDDDDYLPKPPQK